MKKLITLCIALLLGIVTLQAQDSTATTAADKAQLKKIEKSIKQALKEEKAAKKAKKELKKQDQLKNDINKTERKIKSETVQLKKLRAKLDKAAIYPCQNLVYAFLKRHFDLL